MAELLIKAQDNPGDERQAKRGDLIAVMPDGHKWGKGEGAPDYRVVKHPGVPVEKFAAYMEEERDALARDPADAQLIRKRKYAFEDDDGGRFRHKVTNEMTRVSTIK